MKEQITLNLYLGRYSVLKLIKGFFLIDVGIQNVTVPEKHCEHLKIEININIVCPQYTDDGYAVRSTRINIVK